MIGDLFVHQTQRMRQLLAGQHLELTIAVAAGQVRSGLATTVGDKHRAVAKGRGEACGGGVRNVVRYEAHGRRVQLGKRGSQKVWCTAGVSGAEVFPPFVQPVLAWLDQCRVIGIGNGIQVIGTDASGLEAPPGSELGKLPGGKRHRALAVLAAAEPLFLCGGHDLSIDHQRRSRIVENRVDTQDAHLALHRHEMCPAATRLYND